MTIKDMHYDFKKKFNKIDSQQHRNLRVPEIDWALNEAYELFVKLVAQPRLRSYLGFEKSQRTIDDIREVVVNANPLSVTGNIVTLPEDYMFFLRARVSMTKGNCSSDKGVLRIRQHDDEFEESVHHNSSFEWNHVNGLFTQEGIKLFDDGTFTNTSVKLSYIKKLEYIHNAESFRNGTYNLPSGEALTGTQDCILPPHTHREIVDIAVRIASGEIQSSMTQLHQSKLNFNHLN